MTTGNDRSIWYLFTCYTVVLFMLIIAGYRSEDSNAQSFDRSLSKPSEMDSLIMSNDSHLQNIKRLNAKTDTYYNVYLSNKAQEIENLRKQTLIQTVKEIHHIDTVFIETKKNFWGFKKMKMHVVSDTFVSVDSDTLSLPLFLDSINR